MLVIAAIGGGTYLWMTRPVIRIPIAIAPVANHTGESELDAYRLALTETLIDELAESPNVRVVGYPRLLQIVRRFIGAGDVSSSEAIQAIATQSGASFVVVPSLEYRNGAWLAQGQIRNVETGTVTDTYETEPLASSLPKDTVLRQMPLLAERIQAHFKTNGPGRSYTSRLASARFRTLDAAKAFEEGLRAYGDLEYADAIEAFQRAIASDDQYAMAHAWRGRLSVLLYRRNDAMESSQRAGQLINPETPKTDAMFINAVLRETIGEFDAAEQRYRELVASSPDDPRLLAELAEFFRRRDRNTQAVETYHEVLGRDAGDLWAHVQLCQLYTRLGDYPLAESEANAARESYGKVVNRSGEAQALLCLGEAQRLQGGAKLADARRNVAAARAIFEPLGYRYNLSRTAQYQGVVEWVDGHFADAARFFQDASERSRAVGNRSTEGLALMNLGVTERHLGRPGKAIAYLRQSRDIFEQIGIERRAAEAEMNAAGLQIEFGVDEAEAVRRLANAGKMLEKLGLVDFQVSAMDLEAVSLRHAGRPADARRQLLQALSIAREKQLSELIATVTVSLAQTDLFVNDYETARATLEEAVAKKEAAGLNARILLGTVFVRLGEFELARKYLEAAGSEIEAQESAEFTPAVRLALGELAYQSGKLDEARAQFEKASALWIDELPDAASVEARSLLGLLVAQGGASAAVDRMLREAVMQADRMARLDLKARCRLRLARFQILQRRHREALATIDEIPLAGPGSLGSELQAQVHYWRGRALGADQTGAASEFALARKLVATLQTSLPAASRERFAARQEIRLMLSD